MSDGGPAYPHDASFEQRDNEGNAVRGFCHTESGLSKLEWFAGKALTGYCVRVDEFTSQQAADQAVETAILTLKALESLAEAEKRRRDDN